MAKPPKLGPTGRFPEGKLDSTDEGALTIAISTQGGNVRVDFGTKTRWIAFPPDQALAFASAIVARAMALKESFPGPASRN